MTRVVLYVEPFTDVRIPICSLSARDDAIHVEPIPLPSDMDAGARWVAEEAVKDITAAPSMARLPVGVGPHIVFADTGRQR